MPLTREQFQSARNAGFSVEQIVGFEKKRDGTSQQPQTKQKREPIKLEVNKPPTITNPIVAGIKGLADMLPNAQFAAEYYRRGGPFNKDALKQAEQESDILSQTKIEGLVPQVSYGLGKNADLIAGMANPVMKGFNFVGKVAGPIAQGAAGFGSYEALKSIATGRPEEAVQSGQQGAIGGALYGAGGKIGSTVIGRPLQKLTKYAPNIGTSIGAGTSSAIMAPEGERASSFVQGAAFGAKSPQQPFNPAKMYRKATNIYRDVLRPTQGEIKKIEIKRGENINKYYELAAKENLPIEKTSEKKLDTTKAREILQQKIDTNFKRLNAVLSLDQESRFNLNEIRDVAKRSASQKYNNAQERMTAYNEIDSYINAEISQNGNFMVNASTLNRLKQGMWSVGYNQMAPTAKQNARIIGFVAKTAIEKAYPDTAIRQFNQKGADYLNLNTLLENAQGRVIKGGRLGGYFSGGTGAVVGGMAGFQMPFLGGPVGGAFIGRGIARGASEYLNNPARLTKKAGKLANQAQAAENPSYSFDKLLDRIINQSRTP